MMKRILIVDDEESVLFVLRKSLRKLGDEYEIATATSGFQALELLQSKSYDLVVTDYRMRGMDGLQLLDAVQTTHPHTRVVLITAYGNEALEAEAKRLNVYRYLTKPLNIGTFRSIVQEALASNGEVTAVRPGLLIMSDDRYRQVVTLLEQLQGDVGGRCIILTDANGQMIARTGDIATVQVSEIASLLSGSMATLQAAGQALDGEDTAINLSYREGKRDFLYVVNIGQHLLLILVIENGPYSSRLGSVWYYARQTAVTLRQKLGEVEYATTPPVFDNNMREEFEDELDKLFGEDEEPWGMESIVSQTGLPVEVKSSGLRRETAVSPPPPNPPPPNPPAIKPKPNIPEDKLVSFDDAVALGLLPQMFKKSST